jgi:phosphopantothenoylcysteine decarboxylase / phosphopantothenate---cysteine ligase
MSRILLGVSGGVAAYKALEFVRLATAAGHSVRVIQTPSSKRFVGEATFQALSGAPVLSDEFERDPSRGAFPGQPIPDHEPISHLELVAKAELYLIAPASANTLAKLAHGLADNLLTSAALAASCPLVLAPAMNNRMFEHPATQANTRVLIERGASVIGPETGSLASRGEHGIGRLAEPAKLLETCERILTQGQEGQTSQGQEGQTPHGREGQASQGAGWSGIRVLITAGGTREPIDSVRFVGNRSSGRMGMALAHAARARGASVRVIAANVSLPCPVGVGVVEVRTAAELQQACMHELPDCDVLLMAAAVADFRPREPACGKIKKAGLQSLRLDLEPTPDVLNGLAAKRRPDQTLVGFAAEYGEDVLGRARKKLEGKHLDAVVVNDISEPGIGFEVEDNEVTILTRGGEQHVPRASKAHVAETILGAVERLRRKT